MSWRDRQVLLTLTVSPNEALKLSQQKVIINLEWLICILQASTIDGRRKGACLFCHEYFMDLYLLAELKTISLKGKILILLSL